MIHFSFVIDKSQTAIFEKMYTNVFVFVLLAATFDTN